jgi:hypothetical protein
VLARPVGSFALVPDVPQRTWLRNCQEPNNLDSGSLLRVFVTLSSYLLSARFLRESRIKAGTTSSGSGAAVSSAFSIWSR